MMLLMTMNSINGNNGGDDGDTDYDNVDCDEDGGEKNEDDKLR